MTVMVVVMVAAITPQVLAVPGELEEHFRETQTLDLGLEQYSGVPQALQPLRDNRSAQSLHQTPLFLPRVYTCPFLSPVAQVQ